MSQLATDVHIFLSSTFVDLKELREKIANRLRDVFGAHMLVMEKFGSDDAPPVTSSVRKVPECDIFVGIYARRYGSVDPSTGMSITELELREAERSLSAGTLTAILLYWLDESASWLRQRGRDTHQKLLIASDALDVDQILGLHAYFGGTLRPGAAPEDFHRASDFLDERKWIPEPRIRFSAGWGTFLTNDFRGCNLQGDDSFSPVSLVCKLHDVDGRPAVKLSDNYAKALGTPSEIERYRRVFGTAGISNVPVIT